MSGIVIIGAGECGVRAAFALRKSGYTEAITLVSEETALPYERPPLSKTFPVVAKGIIEADAYKESDISLFLGVRVLKINRTKRSLDLAGGRKLFYDKLLIATGARARTLPNVHHVNTLRTIEDGEAIIPELRNSTELLIIGAGLIGLELAATAAELGASVTVVEVQDRAMARAVPAEIAAAVLARHKAAGIKFHFDNSISKIGENTVELGDGTVLEASIIVASIGSVPNIELAKDAGLKTDNGIIVDERLRTNDEHIFAAGDCCSFPHMGKLIRLESWRSAHDQGTHVAHTMLGSDEPYNKTPWFWSDQFDLGIQIAGIADFEHSMIRRKLPNGGFILFQCDLDGVLRFAGGLGTGAEVGKDIRISEMLIDRGARPDPDTLSNPAITLKSLLKQSESRQL